MNIKQLSLEYQNTAHILEIRISELKAELAAIKDADAFSIEKRIDALYNELSDTKKVMSYLERYYS